jgi:chromosomal replication initiation ATPase DnaA
MSIPSVEEILAATHKYFGVPIEVIKDTKYRTPQVCQARGVAALISKKLTFLSYGQLEEPFELDRGTIAASMRKVEANSKKDSELLNKINVIIEEVSKAHQRNQR